jgi:hypothetical protein
MKLRNIIKYTTITLIIILSSLAIFLAYNSYKKIKSKNIVKKDVNSIKNYPYKLSNLATPLYKKKYEELKKVLIVKNPDKKEYARLVAELHTIKFYSLEDFGLEFIIPSLQESYKLKASNSDMYKFYTEKPEIEDVISKISIKEVQTSKYKDLTGYEVEVTIKYKKDLGYPTKVIYQLIKSNDLIYIIKEHTQK